MNEIEDFIKKLLPPHYYVRIQHAEQYAGYIIRINRNNLLLMSLIDYELPTYVIADIVMKSIKEIQMEINNIQSPWYIKIFTLRAWRRWKNYLKNRYELYKLEREDYNE